MIKSVQVVSSTSVLFFFLCAKACQPLMLGYEVPSTLLGNFFPIFINGEYDTVYTKSINTSVSYLFQFEGVPSKKSLIWPARVSVGGRNASLSEPLLVVVKKPKSICSWQIPYTTHGFKTFAESSHTVCPDVIHVDTNETLLISIATYSKKNLEFTLVTKLEKDFVVELSQVRNLFASPSDTIFYHYKFEPNIYSVLLRVTSNDSICMTLSVQNITCPVVDQEKNVQNEGQWQTMTSKGGMLLTKLRFPLGVFIVFVVHSDDTVCSGYMGGEKRNKSISFTIEENISDDEYMLASLSLLSVFAFIYVVAFCMGIKYIKCCSSSSSSFVLTEEPEASASSTNPIDEISKTILRTSSLDSLDETDIDFVSDWDEEKDTFRMKLFLYVSDLSKKEHNILNAKAKLYFWNLITVAIFYSLPVVQLVLTYQKVLNESGNEDLCYYNYLCSHPLWILSDANHVFSNIGYVLFGFLFILITLNRRRFTEQEKHLGIPQHFGFYYALGVALVMEGVLSACYHVCPSQSNFQFDTTFMYVISLLSILKIYQSRHPDLNASAYSTFVALAFFIFVAMIGVLDANFTFYIVFSVIHILICLLLSAQVYYMGRWKIDRKVFHRVCAVWLSDLRLGPRHCCRVMYPSRFILLFIGNICNWALVGLQLHKRIVNFGTYFLAVFMVNLLLYLMFYILMKQISGEKLLPHTWIYLIASFAFWGAALYLFERKTIAWELTPAQSRALNKPCILLNFYDSHDVWHVLSSAGLFFSFMTLLTLDDDVMHRERNTLPVF